mmetsp:Transcript_60725/g.131618  ORF Transcript_60725/g.131618 Transcript_60725/m.131618 type:complete len:490 (+) Transcript_60725:79-1548(+)
MERRGRPSRASRTIAASAASSVSKKVKRGRPRLQARVDDDADAKARQRPPKRRQPPPQRSVFYKQRITALRWRQVEHVSQWQERAQKALLHLVKNLKLGDDEDLGHVIDISTEGVRLPTEMELVEEMMKQRPPETEQNKGKASGSKSSEAEKAAPAEQSSSSTAIVVPPVETLEQIQARLRVKVKIESGKLAIAKEEGRGAPRSHTRKHRSPAGSTIPIPINGVAGFPHKRCFERIAARHVGLTSTTADRMVDDERHPADLSRVPADSPQVDPDAVVITVVVCNSQGWKEQEYDILATQTLAELRDSFHFASDWMFDGPTRMKSAVFFIDGIFYADRRHETALDYSKEIIAWLKHNKSPRTLREDTSRSMDVRLCDLDRIPFGEVCVYVHQGDVEHNVYFTGMRLFNERHDCPLVEAYPVLTYMKRYKKRRCYACWQNHAIWLVLDFERCPYNPSYWCGDCFRHFFQTETGEFLPPLTFKVFPYLHDDF